MLRPYDCLPIAGIQLVVIGARKYSDAKRRIVRLMQDGAERAFVDEPRHGFDVRSKRAICFHSR